MKRARLNSYYIEKRYSKKNKAPKILILLLLLLIVAGGVYFINEGKLQLLFKKEEPIPKETEVNTNVKTQEDLLKEINENPEFYPEGFVDLANKYPDTIDFVYNYKKFVKNKDKYSEDKIDIEKDVKNTKVPLFLQWDSRWGYLGYGDTEDTLAINGCGPTSLAMVLVSLTGDTNINPKTISDFSYENGYYVHDAGTSWTLMSEGAKKLGLEATETHADNIIPALKSGKLIIASMNQGDFTTTGHIIVLYGVDKDDKIMVKDPNSIENSEKTWDINVFREQAGNFWVYSLPENN